MTITSTTSITMTTTSAMWLRDCPFWREFTRRAICQRRIATGPARLDGMSRARISVSGSLM
jgi:hypothetical protein